MLRSKFNKSTNRKEKFSEFRRFSEIDSRFEMWRAVVRISDDMESEIYVRRVPAIRSYSVYLARFIVTTLSRGIRSFGGSFIRTWIRKLCLYIIKVIVSRPSYFTRSILFEYARVKYKSAITINKYTENK